MVDKKYMEKAFMHAMSNPAMRFSEMSVDVIILERSMESYLEERNMDVSEDEIKAFIKDKMAEINEALKDFSYNDRMMK
ncbi:MAG: hypothetical protein PUB87_00545 [Eubacteriaceae bacterium]|nr:hypothetical protein [Eubacteriaceae bacterium]